MVNFMIWYQAEPLSYFITHPINRCSMCWLTFKQFAEVCWSSHKNTYQVCIMLLLTVELLAVICGRTTPKQDYAIVQHIWVGVEALRGNVAKSSWYILENIQACLCWRLSCQLICLKTSSEIQYNCQACICLTTSHTIGNHRSLYATICCRISAGT